MGVVEAETLRRVNEHLGSFERAFDRGVYIRTFLADERLVPRGGERYWPEPDQVEDCRERGRRAVRFVERHGFDVRELRTAARRPGPGPVSSRRGWSRWLRRSYGR